MQLATYVGWRLHGLVQTIFLGIKAAVLVIVIEALLRVAKRALKFRAHWLIAALSFVAISFFAAPFPLIVLAAGLFGFMQAPSDPSAAAPARPTAIRAFNVHLIDEACVFLVAGIQA